MSMIHVTSSKSDDIIAVINNNSILDDNHKKSLKDSLETYEFTSVLDEKGGEFLEKRNRLIIPNEDDGYTEFIINESIKFREGYDLIVESYSYASYLDLKKAKVIRNSVLNEYTVSMAVGWALNGTEWKAGKIESSRFRTFIIESNTNPFAFLRTIANEFDLELNFRVETDGNKITGRYVDLLESVGEWRGREIEFGKDLLGVKRRENTENVYTALIGFGPEREDGTRLEVLVEDYDALQRWGRPDENGRLQHLIDVYEPSSERSEMTLEELTQYVRTELDKRINEVVEYEINVADLENVPNMQNKKIRFGDTLRIKDIKFNPPLYVEARVHTLERSIKDKSKKKVILGDYIEYTEEEVNAIWKQLQEEIQKKLSLTEMLQYTYDKITIDKKDGETYEEGKQFAEAVGTEAKGYADIVAGEAEESAKVYADDVGSQAYQDAIAYAVAEEIYNQKMQEIALELEGKVEYEYIDGELALKVDSSVVQAIQTTVDDLVSTRADLIQDVSDLQTDIATKVDGDWVNGRLSTKADADSVYTISQIDNRLDNYVGVTTYETDKLGYVDRFESAESRITQTETDISSAVKRTEFEQLEDEFGNIGTRIGNAESSISQNATSISQRVLQTDFNSLTGRVSTAESSITTMAGQISLKANQSDLNTVTGELSTLSGEISTMAGEISLKAERSVVEGLRTDFDNLEIGGRNLAIAKNVEMVRANLSSAWEYGEVIDNRTYKINAVIPNGVHFLFGETKAEYMQDYIIHADMSDTGSSVVGVVVYDEQSNIMEEDGLIEGDISWVSTYRSYQSHSDNVIDTPLRFKVIDNRVGFIRAKFGVYRGNATTQDVYIREPKLEKGNKATDWTPAPEDIEAQFDTVTSYISELVVNVDGISGTVSSLSQTVGTHGTNISNLSSQLNVQAGLIEGKVDSTTYNTGINGVINDIKSHNTRISQNASAINLRATKTEVDNLAGKVSSNTAQLSVQAGLIESKVDATYVDNALDINEHVGNGKSFINPISFQDRNSSVKGYLRITTPIRSSFMTKIKITGYNYTTNNAFLDLTVSFYAYPTGILQHSFTSSGNYVVNSVRVARDSSGNAVLLIGESNQSWSYPAITVERADITFGNPPDSYKNGWDIDYVTSIPSNYTDVTNISGTDYKSTLSSHSTSISQNATAITQRATQTSVNALTGRVSTAESSITTMAGQISSKVSSTDFTGNKLVSMINQTPASITLSANKINFNGHVFGTNATFTGDISGATITGSELVSTATNSSISIKNSMIDGRTYYSPNNTTFAFQLRESQLTFEEYTGNNTSLSNLRGRTTIHAQGLDFDVTATGGSAGIYFGAYYGAGYTETGISLFADSVQVTKLDVLGNGNALSLRGSDHTFMEFFHSGSRAGYIGYSSRSANNDLTINNERTGRIRFLGGSVLFSNNVYTSGDFRVSNERGRFVADSNYSYVQATGSEVRATKYAGTTLIPMRASSHPTASSILTKTNIEKFDIKDAYYLLDNAEIYKYHTKVNVEQGIYDKPKIGMITETIPSLLRDEDGIDPYSIVSTLWKVVKNEKDLRLKNEKRIEDLELIVSALIDENNALKDNFYNQAV